MFNWFRRQPIETPIPKPSSLPMVRPGARVLRVQREASKPNDWMIGTDVLELQKTLGNDVLQTGAYDPYTAEAVIEFQKANNLLADGIVGPRTWLALRFEPVGAGAREISRVVSHPFMRLSGIMPALIRRVLETSHPGNPETGTKPIAAVPSSEIEDWTNRLNTQFQVSGIVHPWEVCMFLANVLHETGGFRVMVENLNYSAGGLLGTWPSRFDPQTAQQYARNPFRIAEKVYGGRMGNGPEGSGDGFWYRGAGPIQTTGFNNHNRIGALIGVPVRDVPARIVTRDGGLFAAAQYWTDTNCGEPARRGEVERVRRIVNGGSIGLRDVTARFNLYRELAS